MANVAAVSSGNILIGDSTSPSTSTVITADGGNITAEAKGQLFIATSASRTLDTSKAGANSLLQGMTTGLSFVWLRGRDSAGAPFPFSIEWDTNAQPDIDTCTEFLWSIKVATVDVASIIITNLSGSGVLTIDYVLSGQ